MVKTFFITTPEMLVIEIQILVVIRAALNKFAVNVERCVLSMPENIGRIQR